MLAKSAMEEMKLQAYCDTCELHRKQQFTNSLPEANADSGRASNMHRLVFQISSQTDLRELLYHTFPTGLHTN